METLSTGEVQVTVEVVQIYLYPSELAAFPTHGGYVNDPAPAKRLLDCVIHGGRTRSGAGPFLNCPGALTVFKSWPIYLVLISS